MSVQGAGQRPNILLIVSDDHGYGDLSYRGGCDDVETPNLDRLRHSGMSMEQAYVVAPICSPSRAGLITGCYPQRWGAYWFGNSRMAPETYRTIPEVLAEAGYRTGYFGKVHYGPDQLGSRSCPDQHGFDTSLYGLAAQAMGRLHYMTHCKDARERFGSKVDVHGMFPLYENGEPVESFDHVTGVFTDRTLAFIDEAKAADAPYFCMVAYNAVHNFTWQLPEAVLKARGLPAFADWDPETQDYTDWYEDVIMPNLPNGRAYYVAQLALMDAAIGRLLDQVDENTLVIYMTDNGGSPCNYGDNRPLTGSKYTLYEGGVRVPMLMAWPGVIEPGTTSDALVSSIDLMTTFAEVAGVPKSALGHQDGQSLLPVFAGSGRGHEALFFDTGAQFAVRDADWKLLVTRDSGQAFRDQLLGHEHADIGLGTRLYRIGESVTESSDDDYLCVNADDATNQDVVDRLQRQHDAWIQKMQSANA